MAISITGSVGVSRSQSVEPLPSADADNYLGAAYDVSGNNIVLRNISFKGTGGQIRTKGGIKADGSTSNDYDDYFYRTTVYTTSFSTSFSTVTGQTAPYYRSTYSLVPQYGEDGPGSVQRVYRNTLVTGTTTYGTTTRTTSRSTAPVIYF